MRTIVFYLTSEENCAAYAFAGYEGEHNATRLTAYLPGEMLLGEGAEYRFHFETATGEVVFSMPLTLEPDDSVFVDIPRSLMIPPLLKVVLGCYQKTGDEVTLIMKSAEMHLGIQKSPTEKSADLDASGGKIPGLTIDSVLSADSTNPVESGAIHKALEEKASKAELDVQKKKSLSSANVNEKGELVLVLNDGTKICVGNVVGPQGEKGETGPIGETGPVGPRGEAGADANYALIANALTKKETGNPIVAENVSPFSHEMAVTLSQGGATVTRSGKNLLDHNSFSEQLWADSAEGSSLAIFEGRMATVVPVSPSETYTMSGVSHGGNDGILRIFQTENKPLAGEPITANRIDYTPSLQNQKTFTTAENTHYLLISAGSLKDAALFRFQLEKGENATAYQDFSPPTVFTADESGVVTGMTSLSPTTILRADDTIVISLEYNYDTNLAFASLEEKIAALTAATEGGVSDE